jgi:hypothetical protein
MKAGLVADSDKSTMHTVSAMAISIARLRWDKWQKRWLPKSGSVSALETTPVIMFVCQSTYNWGKSINNNKKNY